jgi:polyisoprenoid-binding protein YceI
MKAMNPFSINISRQSVTLAVFGVAAALIFTGCSDPADNVVKSGVSDAKEAAVTPSSAKQYVINPDSAIGFVGSKVTGSHAGGFKQFSGTLYVADGKLADSSTIEIDMTSTWSDSDRLTGHLKSADFFDVEMYPTATFTLTGVQPGGAQPTMTGNLALHGVTNSISFPADIQVAEEAVSVKAEFAINRKDFNINYPGKTDDLIRDNVVLKLDVTAAPAN